jgi:hypothetical protein
MQALGTGNIVAIGLVGIEADRVDARIVGVDVDRRLQADESHLLEFIIEYGCAQRAMRDHGFYLARGVGDHCLDRRLLQQFQRYALDRFLILGRQRGIRPCFCVLLLTHRAHFLP